MKKQLVTTALILFASIFSLASAQTTDTAKVDNSLAGQYKLVLNKSNTMNGYKIVRISRLSDLYNNFMDTIRQERKQLADAKAKVSEQAKTITSLNNKISLKDENLEKVNDKMDEVNVLGVALTKSTYQIIMWSLVLVLAAALGITVYRSGAYRREARYRVKLFEDLSEEFGAYKTKSIDKEKKLARELQTERNKLEEITARK